jgi:hypothetical protein
MAATVRPDPWLTSVELQRTIPAMKNPGNYDLAATQFGFPKPMPLTASAGSSRDPDVVAHVWSESAVNRWLEEMRAKLEQLSRFV